MKEQRLDIDAIIGLNLRRLRVRAGLSQEDLAVKTGIVKQTISGIENGRIGMGKDIMERFCRTFDIEPWEFFVSDSAPIVTDPGEAECLRLYRQARPLHVAERMTQYGRYMVNEAQQEGEISGRKPPREDKRKSG